MHLVFGTTESFRQKGRNLFIDPLTSYMILFSLSRNYQKIFYVDSSMKVKLNLQYCVLDIFVSRFLSLSCLEFLDNIDFRQLNQKIVYVDFW